MVYNPQFSPSSSERWFNCPGSWLLYNEFSSIIPDKESPYADEGTTAHSCCEKALREKLGMDDPKEGYDFPIAPTNEMLEYAEKYSEFIARKVKECTTAGILQDVYVENKFLIDTFEDVTNKKVRDVYGTVDCAFTYLLPNKELAAVVIDFKYGANVPVYAENNNQLKMYAMALNNYLCSQRQNKEYPLKKVTLVIYQPRCEIDGVSPLRTSVLTYTDLANFRKAYKKATASCFAQKKDETLECKEGCWCTFCDMKGVCPLKQLATKAVVEKVNKSVVSPFNITPDFIKNVIANETNIKNFIEFVKNYAIAQDTAGNPIPGIKIGTTAGRRKWTNNEVAVSMLLANGLSEDDIFTKDVINLTEAKKLLTTKGGVAKSEVEGLIDSATTKTPGTPKVIVEDSVAVDNINFSEVVAFKPL